MVSMEIIKTPSLVNKLKPCSCCGYIPLILHYENTYKILCAGPKECAWTCWGSNVDDVIDYWNNHVNKFYEEKEKLNERP